MMENLAVKDNMYTEVMPMDAYCAPRGGKISEEYLAFRFGRPACAQKPLTCEVTKDLAYLHQYHRLREEMFIGGCSLQKISGKQDKYDDVSDTIVARIGNHVVAGCRLTFSHRNPHALLPMESVDFLLKEQLPGMIAEGDVYVEMSRLAILPEFEGTGAMPQLIRQLLTQASIRKATRVFALSPDPIARAYRKIGSDFGLQWSALHNVVIPEREEYEGVKMVLSSLDMALVHEKNEAAGFREIALTN